MTKAHHFDMSFHWVKRLRMPALLLILAAVLHNLPPILSENFEFGPEGQLLFTLPIAALVCLIAGIGWLIGTVIDALIKRRIRHLALDVEDNLEARKIATQLDVVRRIWVVLVAVITTAAALTVIPGVKQIGVSLFASAGIAGIAIGLAARPMLSNLIAGLQIAFTQPIRIDDVVIVEGEWGWIEQINLFYVVIKLWDWRRLVVPLSYFIETPFQNWTRTSADIIGAVTWDLDHRAPIAEIRSKLDEIVKGTDLWNGDVVNLQVVEAEGPTLTLRALASASTSPRAWDLRCHIREEMITWLQAEHPDALPQQRVSVEGEAPLPRQGETSSA